MQQGYSAPVGKSKSTMILVLGILSIVCCGFLGPVAWYLGNQELQSIRSGALPPSTEGVARAGMILGIVGTVILVATIFWILFLGGLTLLQEARPR
jgi:hypothetical protein